MATFRFRANRWQARVRRLGTPEQTKSFLSRQDAERWARFVEVEIDKGSYVSLAFPQISRQTMMSKLKWRITNAAIEIRP